MAKTNWKGSSGWTSIDDPTGVLNGKVLNCTAGLNSVIEDYLIQLPGSAGTTFTESHYSVLMNYAFPIGSGLHPLSYGELGLVARADNFSQGKALNGYFGKISLETGKMSICRRRSNVETTLVEADMPINVASRGIKHVFEFRCFGTNPVNLQLLIDNTMYCTFGDTTSSLLSEGYSGIRVGSGSAFVDNFSVVKFTSDGAAASDWTPSSAGLSVSAWYKSESSNFTTSSNYISQWNDSSINSNNLTQSTGSNQPYLYSNYVLNKPVVQMLDASSLTASDSSSLDIPNGISVYAVFAPATTTGDYTLFDKGTNYSISVTGTTRNVKFISTSSGSTVNTSTSTGTVSLNSLQLIGVVGGDAFYINGTSSGSITNDVNTLTNSTILTVGPSLGYISEIVLFEGQLDYNDRTKVEGYLAHKWKVQGSLPTSHPYKLFKPVI
jgi:hypothetical protein